MDSPALGFIGFGEAGFHLAKGLREAGAGEIFAYDIHTHTPNLGQRIQGRAEESRTRLVESPEALAQACDILLSTVTAGSAADAARQVAPYLQARHFYADLNSVSPAVKQSIERVISQEKVFASLAETFPGIDWNKLADYMIGRVVEHGERRAHEMEEVADTLRSIGVDPIMAEATARRMHWSAQLGLKDRFGGGAPKNAREFIEAVADASATVR